MSWKSVGRRKSLVSSGCHHNKWGNLKLCEGKDSVLSLHMVKNLYLLIHWVEKGRSASTPSPRTPSLPPINPHWVIFSRHKDQRGKIVHCPTISTGRCSTLNDETQSADRVREDCSGPNSGIQPMVTPQNTGPPSFTIILVLYFWIHPTLD